jgi:hypothetical protein
VDELAELIAKSHARWMPRVVEAIFGTNDPVSVAEELTEAVATTLAVPVVAAQFYEPGVGLVPEAALVGSASVIHPVDWRLDQPDPLPTLDQLDGFVADYEAARGAAFDDDESELLAAGQRWVASSGARCQHSDDLLGLFPHVDHSRGWPRILRELLGR